MQSDVEELPGVADAGALTPHIEEELVARGVACPNTCPYHVDVTRTFGDLSDSDMADIEKATALVRYGWGGGFGWDEVFQSQRVLLISEAGVGKTHECKAQMTCLRADHAPAFFLELGTLATTAPIDMLLPEEEVRFEGWLNSQEETATFFLDSIDELKLTRGSFKQALIRFGKALGGQLARARIVITTRPVPFGQAARKRRPRRSQQLRQQTRR